jgi:hypothetical protein
MISVSKVSTGMIARRLFVAAAASAMVTSGPVLAQTWSHAPNVKEETNADYYHYEYDDGACYINYQYNFHDRHEYMDRHGDCAAVGVPHYPGPNRVRGY